MRVGLFVDAYIPEINGVVTSTKTLCDALINKGDEVYVVTTNPFSKGIMIQDNVIRLPGLELKKLYGYRVAMPYSKKAENIIRKLNLDVIHVQTEASIGIFGRILAKKYGIPLIYTYHTMYVDYTYYVTKGFLDPVVKGIVKKLSKALADSSTELITTSDKTKSALRSYNVDQYINVIPNGIDLSVFKPTESNFREKYYVKDKFVILGVAFGWGKRKGLDVFIELSKRLDKNFQIVLVGTDENLDKQLPENIISIHRTQNQIELAEIYSAADLFVNPTREDTFPTVNIESLACGTPIVTFRTGGSPDVIDKTCGSVVDKNDVDGIEKEIIRIKEQKPYSKEACLKRASNFDKSVKFAEYIDLYKE